MFKCLDWRTHATRHHCYTVMDAWEDTMEGAEADGCCRLAFAAMLVVARDYAYNSRWAGHKFRDSVDNARNDVMGFGPFSNAERRSALRGVDFALAFAVANRLG